MVYVRAYVAYPRREHGGTFLADGQLSLINRLRHNVIKAGLRKINVAYARISIADICEKLKLEDKQDAE
jgi:26S proteasome regulatory subunit N3